MLFLDEHDDSLTQLAVAYATRAFSEIGHYASAGFAPAENTDEAALAFLKENGYEPEGQRPTRFEDLSADLADFHVIASFDPGARERIPELPFHTTLLHWSLPEELSTLEEKHRWVCAQVADLMELLRGEGARP